MVEWWGNALILVRWGRGREGDRERLENRTDTLGQTHCVASCTVEKYHLPKSTWEWCTASPNSGTFNWGRTPRPLTDFTLTWSFDWSLSAFTWLQKGKTHCLYFCKASDPIGSVDTQLPSDPVIAEVTGTRIGATCRMESMPHALCSSESSGHSQWSCVHSLQDLEGTPLSFFRAVLAEARKTWTQCKGVASVLPSLGCRQPQSHILAKSLCIIWQLTLVFSVFYNTKTLADPPLHPFTSLCLSQTWLPLWAIWVMISLYI